MNKTPSISRRYHTLRTSGLFSCVRGYPGWYDLKDTHYMCDGYNYWVLKRPKGAMGDKYEFVSFESVLDSVPEDVQTRLLFHLDVFIGEEICFI